MENETELEKKAWEMMLVLSANPHWGVRAWEEKVLHQSFDGAVAFLAERDKRRASEHDAIY